jgi:hypothetical protein
MPNDKKPLIREWPYAVTCDEAKIKEWSEKFPDCNWGISMDGFATVDVDPRNGGNDTFLELVKSARLNDPENHTLVSKTHSGGYHYIFKLPPAAAGKRDRLKGRAHAFGRGVDLKTGAGQYIVGPGSTIKGNEYRWINDNPIATMPDALIEIARKAGSAKPKSSAAGVRLVEEDDEAIERATLWLHKASPTAELGNRDNTAFQVAARLYDFGVSKETCLDMMLSWTDAKCEPPLELDEIERIVESAFRNRSRPIGVDHPNNPEKANGFEPVEIDESRKPKARESDQAPGNSAVKSKFYSLSAAECARRAKDNPQEWLIENILHRGAEGVMIGGPSKGKTFSLIDLGLRVARGKPWAGNPTLQGGVVYIAAEDQSGINTRLGAWEEKHGPIGDDCPFDVIPVAPDFAHGQGDARELVEHIQEIEARRGSKTALIIVDTLNRALAGADESSSKDMGRVLNCLRLLREATGAATLTAHHPGWKNSNRARGHSSLFGAVDTQIIVEDNQMVVDKIRNGKRGYTVRFRLVPISYAARDGRTIPSCYFEPVEANDGFEQSADFTPEQWSWFTDIADVARGEPFGVRPLAKQLGMNHTTLLKRLTVLVQAGWITKLTDGEYDIDLSGLKWD